jgi:AcrR family transcriptional regulator
MRYPREHKAQARKRIVAKSAALAKRAGFNASGVDRLAKAAGVTSGAVYKHFDGKDELLAEILEAELAATQQKFAIADLARAIDRYVSMAHVEHPEAGCPLPALASEIARASAGTRRRYETAMLAIVDTLAERLADGGLGAGPQYNDRARAWSIIATCVGAVTVARGLASAETRTELLDAARATAHDT